MKTQIFPIILLLGIAVVKLATGGAGGGQLQLTNSSAQHVISDTLLDLSRLIVVGRPRVASACQFDCTDAQTTNTSNNNNNQTQTTPLCASDGHLYESICALYKRACLQGTFLYTSPHDECSHEQRTLQTAEASPCTRHLFDEFKTILLGKFKQNIEFMFKHFDQNNDNHLEPREFWLRTKLDARHLDAGAQTRPFPFEQLFERNPCSLSHLFVFDERHRNKLNFDEFAQMFHTNKVTHQQENNRQQTTIATDSSSMSIAQQANVTTIKSVVLRLGTDTQLECEPAPSSSSCAWFRYGRELAPILTSRRHPDTSEHLSIEASRRGLRLHIRDAQMHLSGEYMCACTMPNNQIERIIFHLSVSVEPRVLVRPKFQWSLQNSRVAFECQHNFIDTTWQGTQLSRTSWLKNGRVEPFDDDDDNNAGSTRVSVDLARNRLSVEQVKPSDSGRYECRVDVTLAGSNSTPTAPTSWSSSSSSFGRLLVQDGQRDSSLELTSNEEESGARRTESAAKFLWMFHANGVSVYKVHQDDGQQLELVKRIAGSSRVAANVDGNWNQLTLCGGGGGGANSEQVVACEWSDNAVELRVPPVHAKRRKRFDNNNSTSTRNVLLSEEEEEEKEEDDYELQPNDGGKTFVYVGQPNLNRVLVMDGRAHELVAIINTDPQPRRLFPFKPNKIHLSKWVRRRLAPSATARWLDAIKRQHNNNNDYNIHPLEYSPKSARLYSTARNLHEPLQNDRQRRRRAQPFRMVAASEQDDDDNTMRFVQPRPLPPKLVQFDIWLLCDGQPAKMHMPQSNQNDDDEGDNLVPRDEWLAGDKRNSDRKQNLNDHREERGVAIEMQHKRAMAERKSIQIIQSTFFTAFLVKSGRHHSHHSHAEVRDEHNQEEEELGNVNEIDNNNTNNNNRNAPLSAVNEFKRLAVLTTHYVIASPSLSFSLNRRRRRHKLQDDHNDDDNGQAPTTPRDEILHHEPAQHSGADNSFAVRDLFVPERPELMRESGAYKLHSAYVIGYAKHKRAAAAARLFRVSTDNYRYDDRDVELEQNFQQDCDPINLLVTAQGLVIVQCGASIEQNNMQHSNLLSPSPPSGQLVLDQITGAQIEYNENIRAQSGHLSPDHKYLVSVFSNKSSPLHGNISNHSQRFASQSIIFVQSISTSGLKLQYEIKTSLEIVECSFVWKEGQYAAVFVSLNRRDEQTELLNLRLADGRLELMVRVPGLVELNGVDNHRPPALTLLADYQLVALSTQLATYMIDIDENRVTQTLQEQPAHSSTPTLLWT